MTILICCFTRTFSIERVIFHNAWQCGKGFTVEELFRSPFTELWPSFHFNSIKTFSKFSGWTSKCFFLLFDSSIVYFIYLWWKAAIKLTKLFSISLKWSWLVLIIRIWNKLYKKELMLKVLIQIHQILKPVEKFIHIFFIWYCFIITDV